MESKEHVRLHQPVNDTKCVCPHCNVTGVDSWDGLDMCDQCRENLICLRETVRHLRRNNP